MKNWMTSAAVVLALTITGSALAQCCASKSKHAAKPVSKEKAACSKTCDVKKAGCSETCDKSKSCCDKDKCHGSVLAQSGAPLMQFELTTCCPKQAADMAANRDVRVAYHVGDKRYECKESAMEAYAALLSKHLESMTHVRYAVGDNCVGCPKTAQVMAKAQDKPLMYRVGHVDFARRDHAQRAAERAMKAAEGVKIRMVVDGKEYDCDPSECGKRVALVSDKGKSCDPKACSTPCGDKNAKGALASVEGKTCDKSGKATLASSSKGKSCDKPCDKPCDKAAQAMLASNEKGKTCDKPCNKPCDATQVRMAANTKVCPVTGDKGANCPANGKDCEYLVGQTRTKCGMTARVELVKARIAAAAIALEQARGEEIARNN